MLSEGARFTSATGTYKPSIWQKESPNCSLAMSLRPGSCFQPVSLTSTGPLKIAPQRGQLSCFASTSVAHHGQVVRCPAGAGVRFSAPVGATRATGGTGGGGAGAGGGTACDGAPGRFTRAPHPPQKFAVSSTAR